MIARDSNQPTGGILVHLHQPRSRLVGTAHRSLRRHGSEPKAPCPAAGGIGTGRCLFVRRNSSCRFGSTAFGSCFAHCSSRAGGHFPLCVCHSPGSFYSDNRTLQWVGWSVSFEQKFIPVNRLSPVHRDRATNHPNLRKVETQGNAQVRTFCHSAEYGNKAATGMQRCGHSIILQNVGIKRRRECRGADDPPSCIMRLPSAGSSNRPVRTTIW